MEPIKEGEEQRNDTPLTLATPQSGREITPMTPVSRESRPPSGWGLDAPVKGIFTEDEMEMLVGWGKSNARGTGQILKPAEKIMKKRRLLEWFDTYSKPEVLPPHGGTIAMDIKNMVVYLGAKDSPAFLTRLVYKKKYLDGQREFVNVSTFIEDGDATTISLGNHYISASVIDTKRQKLYVTTSDSPSWVFKIDLDKFEIEDSIKLQVGENAVSCIIHDPKENMLYVGTWTVQAKVVSLATGDGGVPFSRIDCLNLDYAAGDSYLRTVVHDSKRGYLLFATSQSPAKMIRCSCIPLTHIETIKLDPGENHCRCSISDPKMKHAYYGTETKPAKIVQMDMETWRKVKVITLPDGYDDMRCCALDKQFPKRPVGYFATYANPAHIIKVDLDKMKVEKSLVLNEANGEEKCNDIAIDGDTGIAVMTMFTDPGRLVRVLIKPKTVIEAVLDAEEINIMHDIGDHEAEMERARRQRFQQLRATQLLQKWVRERQRLAAARRERARLLALRDSCARMVQRLIRGLLGRLKHKRIRLAYFNENRARAVAIAQRSTRAAAEAIRVRANNREIEYLATRIKSILLIQRIWRGKQGKAAFLIKMVEWKHQQAQMVSIVKIQRIWRGRMARRLYNTMRQLYGVVQMQRIVRGKIARKNYMKMQLAWLLSVQERAVLVIASAIRGYKARRRTARLRQQRIETMAAIKIQAKARRLRAKRELERRQLAKQAALMMTAKKIQMRWRAYVSRKRAWGRRRGRLEGRAAEVLQAVLRQYVVRKKYQQTVIARSPQLFQQCTSWLRMYDRLRTAIQLPEGPTDHRVRNMAKNATISANVIAMEALTQNRYTWAFAVIKRMLYVLRTPNLDFASKDQLVALTKRNIQQIRYRLYDTYP